MGQKNVRVRGLMFNLCTALFVRMGHFSQVMSNIEPGHEPEIGCVDGGGGGHPVPCPPPNTIKENSNTIRVKRRLNGTKIDSSRSNV